MQLIVGLLQLLSICRDFIVKIEN